MGQDKTAANKIQDYYNLSLNYLESAKISLKKELFEPAMFPHNNIQFFWY